ncbi:DNA polymerase ligase-domain-containing protein [Daldinia caldariorum]|uniref:DNA polymerase ligase-domain-containing protein n=1 Tax=Daldinia caldariorum TaxID=326644 RepID=UPI002007FCFD|nr:DNA polymerase ligase-domain-containing protein [Daldinia caldariorum]KAI1465516.1 DNA polymerase ligase-domain-containing protein [Daldinia caldariorum]
MSPKQGFGPQLVGNPFIKKENLEWTFDLSNPACDSREDSSSDDTGDYEPGAEGKNPKASAVEAGEARIDDYLGYFSGLLEKAILSSPFPSDMPRLPIEAYRKLYEENSGNPRGAHFVVHQHDHPIAGTHYDLRLQINETSSASWAIMYGLPGDPNSQRLNRNATETRIHCLWNHLIETASISTGSLLVWDTGTYTVLPPRGNFKPANFNSQSDAEERGGEEEEEREEKEWANLTEQEKLHHAFQMRKIRIRLAGTRLPHNYVLNLRLTKADDAAGRAKSTRGRTRGRRRGAPLSGLGRRRRRRGGGRKRGAIIELETSSDSDSDSEVPHREGHDGDGAGNEESEIIPAAPPAGQVNAREAAAVSAVEREIRELEDEQVRRTNAYPGAENSIGSVHQRRWYLSLDREACGFVKRRRAGRVVWEDKEEAKEEGKEEVQGHADDDDDDDGGGGSGSENRLKFPFYVCGAELERSVVTGRTGADVLKDEGVVGHIGRKGWRPVLN